MERLDKIFATFIGMFVGGMATIATVLVCALADLPVWIGISSMFFMPIGALIVGTNSSAFWRKFDS